MRRTGSVALVLAILIFGATTTSQAAIKYTTSANAIEKSACKPTSEISLSKTGPLYCKKGVWSLIAKSQDNVSTRAYGTILERYNSKSDATPKLSVHLDPLAGNWKNGIVKSINVAARLWGTSTESERTIPIYVSETSSYISENLSSDGITENQADKDRNKEAASRGGGQAGFHGQYFDFIFSEKTSKSTGYYQAGSHEYTHYSQMVFSQYRSTQGLKEFWINEGCASYIGMSLGGLIGFPQNQRTELISYLKRQQKPAQLTFFSKQDEKLYSNPHFNEIFDTGAVACEALVALAGVNSLENYFRYLAQTDSTPESVFPEVFGSPMTSMIALLQLYVDSVRSGHEMSLNQLNQGFKKIKI
jgi:hypothetical protein